MDIAIIGVAIVGSLIGLIAGILLGLNGFAQPATPGPLGQSPRIKNLLWLFSGLFPFFVADYKKLNLPSDFPWFWPFCGYAIGAVIGAAIAIFWMIASIRRSSGNFNATKEKEFWVDGDALVREYLTYGKNRYDELWTKEREKSEVNQKNFELTAARRNLDVEADKLVAQCVFGVFGHLSLSDPERKKSEGRLVDTIIDAILKIVRAHGPDLTLRGSHMVFVQAKQTDEHFKGRARFTKGMPDSYRGYLELRRGGGIEINDIVVPVATQENLVLPGAAEAVHVIGAAVMNIREIEYRDGVIPSIRKEIDQYFSGAYFAPIESIASLVISDGATICGVVNIESSAKNLLGSDRAEVQTVLGRLQALVALLSIVR